MGEQSIKRFVLLFEGRTGSSYLISMLASHPEILAESEMLVGKGDQEQRAFLESFFTAIRGPEIRAVGFKTKLRDIAEPDFFRQFLEEAHVDVIHMQRENVLKLAVSRLNARRLFRERGVWNLSQGAAPLPPFAPSPDEIDECIRFHAAKNLKLEQYLASLGRPVLRVTYEALLETLRPSLQRIFDFLQVRPEFALAPTVAKNTSDDLRQTLSNYDELLAHYRGTPYEGMF